MRLKVRHDTRYDYGEPVAYSVQRLYLTPPSFASQKVVSWAIAVPGIENALNYVDAFGNRVHLVTASGLHDHVAIIAEGIAECTDAAGLVRGLHCPAPDSIFARQTQATEPDPAIRALAAEAQGSGDFGSLWAGQAAPLGRELPAGELTRALAADALARLAR